MWLLAVFIVVPLVEISLFVVIGGAIGLVSTLAVVVGTAVAGTMLVRSQGGQVLLEIRQGLRGLRDPAAPLAHGALILVAGILLLTPGFATDAAGFALLFPPWRKAVIAQGALLLARRAGARREFAAGPIIDVEPVSEQQPPQSPNGNT